MHFEPMVSAVPLHVPTISYLDTIDGMVTYVNDLSNAEAIKGKAKKVEGTDKSMWANAEEKDTILKKRALNWMNSSMEEQCGLPFGVALGVATFGVPMVAPEIGIGAALIAGYLAGAVTFYLEFRGTLQIKNETS